MTELRHESGINHLPMGEIKANVALATVTKADHQPPIRKILTDVREKLQLINQVGESGRVNGSEFNFEQGQLLVHTTQNLRCDPRGAAMHKFCNLRHGCSLSEMEHLDKRVMREARYP